MVADICDVYPDQWEDECHIACNNRHGSHRRWGTVIMIVPTIIVHIVHQVLKYFQWHFLFWLVTWKPLLVMENANKHVGGVNFVSPDHGKTQASAHSRTQVWIANMLVSKAFNSWRPMQELMFSGELPQAILEFGLKRNMARSWWGRIFWRGRDVLSTYLPWTNTYFIPSSLFHNTSPLLSMQFDLFTIECMMHHPL